MSKTTQTKEATQAGIAPKDKPNPLKMLEDGESVALAFIHYFNKEIIKKFPRPTNPRDPDKAGNIRDGVAMFHLSHAANDYARLSIYQHLWEGNKFNMRPLKQSIKRLKGRIGQACMQDHGDEPLANHAPQWEEKLRELDKAIEGIITRYLPPKVRG